MWLKTGLLLAEAGDSVLGQCFAEILESYGGYKALLTLLLESSSLCQLQTVHDIILNQFRKEQLRKLKSVTVESAESRSVSISSCRRSISLFALLPNVSLSHICSYLTKENISNLKLTSKQLGIICLEEMEKICVQTLNINNGNNLFSDYSECQCLLDLKNLNLLRYARYHSKIRHCALFEEWEQIYNIPQRNQLIFRLLPNSNNIKAQLFDSDAYRLHAIETSASFLVCDNRNVIVLSNDGVRRFDAERDAYACVKEYNLMMLEYFCVYSQTMHIAQTILCKAGLRKEALFEYMQHKFILLSEEDNEWYDRFKNECESMEEPQFRLYQHRETDFEMHAIAASVIPFENGEYKHTFQLITTSRRLVSARVFCGSLTSINVAFSGNVSNLNDMITDYNNLNIDSIANPFTLRTSRHTLSWNMKIAISERIWNGVVPPHFFELFAKDVNVLNDDNVRYIPHSHCIGSGDFEYKLCLHDSTKPRLNDEDKLTMYKVRIYDIFSNPYPICFDDDEAGFGQEVIVRYAAASFTSKEFINYLFVQMDKAIKCNPLFKVYETFVNLYYNKYENKVKCMLCPANICDKRRRRRSNKFKYITPYDDNEQHEYMPHSFPVFDLFMLKIRGKSIERPLPVKFIANEPIPQPMFNDLSEEYQQSFMTIEELRNLQELDELDHRDIVGRFVLSEIIETHHEMNRVLIHYEGWSSRYDVWCDYVAEPHRFARANSISRLRTQRLNDLQVGDRVDLCRNPMDGNGRWRAAKIKRFDADSSQVEVMYVKEVRSDGIRGYRRWVHLDNVNEIDYYGMRLFASEYHADELRLHQEERNDDVQKCVGMPLTVWIKPGETLESVIEKYMNGSQKYIHSVYRVNKAENKLIRIAKYKRRRYEPFKEIVGNESDDFIVIKIRTNRIKQGYIPIYPKFVHD